MRLLADERISNVVDKGAVERMRCSECREPAIRLVLMAHAEIAEEPNEGKRNVPLCKEHFIDACILFPELRRLAAVHES